MRLGTFSVKTCRRGCGRRESKLRRAVDSLRAIVPAASGSRHPHRHREPLGNQRRSAKHHENRPRARFTFPGNLPRPGQFPRGIDPLAGLRLLAPHAVILHAKSYGFRSNGEEKTIDYRQYLPIFRRSGFDGPITVEYEGLGNDLEGCRLTRALLLRYW